MGVAAVRLENPLAGLFQPGVNLEPQWAGGDRRGPATTCADASSARMLARVTDDEPICCRSVTFSAGTGETIPVPLAPGCYLVVTYSPVVKLLA